MNSERSTIVAAGKKEAGIVIGNTYDKYGSKNPVVVWMMNGFADALERFVSEAKPNSIHEVGCGEGHWASQWASQGFNVRGTDISEQVIELARQNARGRRVSQGVFEVRSVYDLEREKDSADLIVCCEVLEHVSEPQRALQVLQRVVRKDIILSVPREPLWRALNCARGKYIKELGNTPGHINHWSSSGFISLVEKYFEIVSVAQPLPWTMVHCKKNH